MIWRCNWHLVLSLSYCTVHSMSFHKFQVRLLSFIPDRIYTTSVETVKRIVYLYHFLWSSNLSNQGFWSKISLPVSNLNVNIKWTFQERNLKLIPHIFWFANFIQTINKHSEEKYLEAKELRQILIFLLGRDILNLLVCPKTVGPNTKWIENVKLDLPR